MLIISLILFQLIVFVGLIFFFKRILSQNVTSATKHLEELNQDYARKDNEVTKRLGEAQQKSEDMLVKARQEADSEKEKIIKEAWAQRDKILNHARNQSDEIIQQAENSRRLLISELEERISKETINKACELIQHTLPEQFKKDVHLHWTEELIEDSFNQLDKLQIPEDINEVKITSAFPLSDEQRKRLSKRLKQLLSRDVKYNEETDSKIVAGLIVSIGSLVLDGSLKNRIQEQARSIEHESSE